MCLFACLFGFLCIFTEAHTHKDIEIYCNKVSFLYTMNILLTYRNRTTRLRKL